MDNRPRVVIIGAGFAGLWAARELSREAVNVTLIDRNNYHTFLPLLYQVAAAELKPEDIAYPIRALVMRMPNTEFIMDCVSKIDLAHKTVYAGKQKIAYDYLILSFGSTSDYYGIPGAATCAFPLKTLEDGVCIRNHFLGRLERAAHETDPVRRKCLLTFVIVGGGPTGVEYAGAVSELIFGPVAKDYPEINIDEISIIILEGGPRLLQAMPEEISDYTLKRLEKMGVTVCLNARVTSIDEYAVCLKDADPIPTETVVWTAGIRGIAAAEGMGIKLAPSGRVAVLPTLQISGHETAYVAGDMSLLKQNERPLPMVAPVAVQQGRQAAQNILRQIKGQQPEDFSYRDRGAMVTIGRNSAAAYVGGKVYTGFIAWVLWLGVHIFNLIGIPNRLFVMMDWAMDYFFMERTVRIILPGEDNCILPEPPASSPKKAKSKTVKSKQ